MGIVTKIILYIILAFFVIEAALTIIGGQPNATVILQLILYAILLFLYPRLFDKLYEKGGNLTLLLSSIEIATIGAIIGIVYFENVSLPKALLLGATIPLLVIQLHELGHYVFAKKYRLEPVSLPIRKVFKIDFGITLAAVVHKKAKTFKENMIIAVAGPFMNLLLAAIFLVLFTTGFNTSSFVQQFYQFNFGFGMLNLIVEGIPALFSPLTRS